MRNRLFLLIAALALFVPTAFHLYNFFKISAAQEEKTVFRLPIRGFDPRDFSRGRYAQLTIDWKPDHAQPSCYNDMLFEEGFRDTPASQGQGRTCGLCLTKQTADKTYISFVPSDELQSSTCDMRLPDVRVSLRMNEKGKKETILQPYLLKPMRFYMDETVANRADKALRENKHNFTADIIFTDDTTPAMRAFYIDGVPYRDYLGK